MYYNKTISDVQTYGHTLDYRVVTLLTLHEDSLQYWKDLDTDYKASFQVALRKTTASNLKICNIFKLWQTWNKDICLDHLE